MNGSLHLPVLRDRVIALLVPGISAVAESGATPVVVDATVGLGGHSAALLEADPRVQVIGLDRDPEALIRAGERLAGDRFIGVHTVFDELADAIAAHTGPRERVAGVLFDLGVSSMQLDLAERGFAYRTDAPLDMRMDQSTGPTAAELLNTADRAELTRILREYGEERFAGRIAAAVVREREQEPFDTSGRLVELLYDVIPAPARRTGGHPAKRTFQALRVAVNAELDVLGRAIPDALSAVAVGGRVVVESYQSLEDRIVKRVFSAATTSSAPPDLPVVPEELRPDFRLLTRGAEQADQDEIDQNPRAASVRLRAVQRTRPTGRPITDRGVTR